VKKAVVTLAHPQHAGMLRALRILDDAAAAHGWTLHFAVPEPHPLLAATGLDPARTTVVPGLGRWRRWRGRLAAPFVVRRLAGLARDASVFYSETLSTFPYCWLAGRLTGVPTVVHVYSSYPKPRPYRKHWLARARHVIAPSADSLELARRAIGGFPAGTRAIVAYNGMDIARLEREAAAPLPAHLPAIPPGPRIGMVGNLDPRKNPATLIAALPAIRAAVPDVRVLLIGAFPDAATEEKARAQIAALGVGDAVTVTGFLPNPFPLVRTLDVLVHPALRDPFPLALLEGMALARPIVASAVGGIPEMLVDGESGILMPPQDPAALAEAVIGLLRDPARRAAVGTAAHARLAGTFSLAGFAATMFGAFDAAAAEVRR
jgi:glycosyltransferase involved in cell wall biosynthesis